MFYISRLVILFGGFAKSKPSPFNNEEKAWLGLFTNYQIYSFQRDWEIIGWARQLEISMYFFKFLFQ